MLKSPFIGLLLRENHSSIQVPLSQKILHRIELIPWSHNAFRHSTISYRLALAHNIAEVALKAGHSPEVIRSYYLNLVKPSEAKAYSKILPRDEDEEYRQTIEKLLNADLAAAALKARKEIKKPTSTKTKAVSSRR